MPVCGTNVRYKIKDVSTLCYYVIKFDLEKSALPKGGNENNFQYKGNVDGITMTATCRDSECYLDVGLSLQKFWKGNNSGDFNFDDLSKAIVEFPRQFNITGSKLDFQNETSVFNPYCFTVDHTLKSIEVSINIRVPYADVNKFLKDNVVQHKYEPFDLKDGAFRCEHDNYHLKLYEKEPYILRFEIKLFAKELRKYKLKIFSDLNENKLVPVLQRMDKEFKEIIWKNGINIHRPDRINEAERLCILENNSDWFYADYLKDRKNAATKREKGTLSTQQSRRKKKMMEVLAKGDGTSATLSKLVTEKINLYLNDCLQNADLLHS